MFFLSLSIYLIYVSFPFFFLFLLFFLYFFFFLLTSYLCCYSFYFSLLSLFHFYFYFMVVFSIICVLFPGNQIRLKSADACSAVVVSLRSYVHHNWSYYPTIILYHIDCFYFIICICLFYYYMIDFDILFNTILFSSYFIQLYIMHFNFQTRTGCSRCWIHLSVRTIAGRQRLPNKRLQTLDEFDFLEIKNK